MSLGRFIEKHGPREMVPLLNIRSGKLTAAPASVKSARQMQQRIPCGAQSGSEGAGILVQAELSHPIGAIATEPQRAALAVDFESLVFTGVFGKGANGLGAITHR